MKVNLEGIRVSKEKCPACDGEGHFSHMDTYNHTRDIKTKCDACMGTTKVLKVHDFPGVPEGVELYIMASFKGGFTPLHQILLVNNDGNIVTHLYPKEQAAISETLQSSWTKDWMQVIATAHYDDENAYHKISTDLMKVTVVEYHTVRNLSVWALFNTEALKLHGFIPM